MLSFRVALAVIAVAVADDAFAHREPGTTVSDHLISGLVPLAVAGALAWAYPRLRPGARASVAIVCGVLAAVAGVSDGLRHVLVERLSGDDATVMLAGVVGLALVADGVRRLWRSRRREGRAWARRLVLAVAAALATFFVVLPVGLAIVATHKARSPVTATLGQDVTAAHRRRPGARRLVRAVAQRRGRDRLSGSHARDAATCAAAGRPRVRRAHARPAGRGEERGRAEPVRLERRGRPASRR